MRIDRINFKPAVFIGAPLNIEPGDIVFRFGIPGNNHRSAFEPCMKITDIGRCTKRQGKTGQ